MIQLQIHFIISFKNVKSSAPQSVSLFFGVPVDPPPGQDIDFSDNWELSQRAQSLLKGLTRCANFVPFEQAPVYQENRKFVLEGLLGPQRAVNTLRNKTCASFRENSPPPPLAREVQFAQLGRI